MYACETATCSGNDTLSMYSYSWPLFLLRCGVLARALGWYSLGKEISGSDDWSKRDESADVVNSICELGKSWMWTSSFD